MKHRAYLSDGKGRSLYLFEADKGANSTCSSACASIWPPLTASGAVKSGAGVSASLLGTSKRTDGSTEITYNGHPLYYYVGHPYRAVHRRPLLGHPHDR